MNSLDNKNQRTTRLKHENGKLPCEVDSAQLIQSYIKSLKHRRFFGQVVLKIEAGEVVYINEHVGRTPVELLEALQIEAQATKESTEGQNETEVSGKPGPGWHSPSGAFLVSERAHGRAGTRSGQST